MQNLIWKIILIALLLIGCVFAVTPPDKKIRLGRDLSGGVSLIYSVRMGDDVDRRSVLSQTIEVLKERVNPDGVFDIQMTPLGTDRIEVVMPLPSPQVKELATIYRGHLDILLKAAQIRASELDQALSDGNAHVVLGDEGVRGTLIANLQLQYLDLQRLTTELEANPSNGSLEQQVADIEIQYEDNRELLLAMSLDRNEIARLLQLSPLGEPLRDGNNRVIRDSSTDEVLRGVAARDVAFAELETAYPQLSTKLGTLLDTFDDYQDKRSGFDDPEDLIRMLRGAGGVRFPNCCHYWQSRRSRCCRLASATR